MPPPLRCRVRSGGQGWRIKMHFRRKHTATAAGNRESLAMISPLRFFRMISAFTRPLITMKTPSRFTRIFTILATVSMAAVAVAQPPPGGPGGPFGPGPGPGRGPGRPGFGPGPRPPLVELLVPPPPLYYHHHRYYSGDSGSSTVSRVQRALKTRGYYSGPVDGDAGSGTRAGIRSFREDNGLRSSTKIDGALLGALGL